MGVRMHRAKGAAEGGQIWGGARGETGPSQGLPTPLPAPQEATACMVVTLALFSGLVVTCKAGPPVQIQGAGPGAWKGAWEAGLIFLTPACPPALPSPGPTSFSLCSMTLFVCL